MKAESYYTIIRDFNNKEFVGNDLDKEDIRDFLLTQTGMDLQIGDLFLQEGIDLRTTIITMLT